MDYLPETKDNEGKIELIIQEEIEMKKAILHTCESSLNKEWSRSEEDSAWADL